MPDENDVVNDSIQSDQPKETPPPPPPVPEESEAPTVVIPAQIPEAPELPEPPIAEVPIPSGEAPEESLPPVGTDRLAPVPPPPAAQTMPPGYAQQPYQPQGTPLPPQPAPLPQYSREQEFLQRPYATEPKAGPSAMALIWRAIWDIPLTVWRGRPLDGLDQAHQVKEKTGNSWMVWVVTLVVNVVLMAITVTAMAGRSYRAMSSWVPTQDPMQGSHAVFPALNLGQLIVLFLASAVAFTLVLAARAFSLYLTQRVAGAVVSFTRVATSFAGTQMVYTLPLAVVALLALLGGLPAVFPVVLILAAGLGIMVEVFNYLAVLKEGPHRFSPLVPFAWFTVLAMVIAGLIEMLVLQLVIAGTAW